MPGRLTAMDKRKEAEAYRIDSLWDNQLAELIDALEYANPRKGTFDAWRLSYAQRELDNRL